MPWPDEERRKSQRHSCYDDLLERIHGIEREIIKMSSYMESEISGRKVFMEEVTKIVREHEHAIHGNSRPGIQSDLKLIQNTLGRYDWHLKTLTAAVVVAFINIVITYFRK